MADTFTVQRRRTMAVSQTNVPVLQADYARRIARAEIRCGDVLEFPMLAVVE